MKDEIKILSDRIATLEKEKLGLQELYCRTREELDDLQDSYQDKIVSAIEDRRIAEEIYTEWDLNLSSSLNRVITDQSVAIVKEVEESIRVGIMNSMSVFSISLMKAYKEHLERRDNVKNRPSGNSENKEDKREETDAGDRSSDGGASPEQTQR